jgi:pimeloyl-ACP methyl ester carboxylesterase
MSRDVRILAVRAWGAFGALVVVPACIQPPAAVDPAAAAATKEPARGPVVAWTGRGPGDLYEPGLVRGFEIHQGGVLVGHSWGRYLGPQGKTHVFETRIELLPPGSDPMRSEGRLVLDERGRLISGYERSVAAELKFHVEDDAVMITDGKRSDEIGYTPDRYDTAVMAHGALLHQEIMFGLRKISEDPMAWRIVSLSGSAPFEWEAEMLTVPAGPDQPYRLQTNLGEEITLIGGRIVEIEAVSAAQKVVAMRGEVPWPEWTVSGPQKLRYEMPADARFQRKELELAGRAEEPKLYGELLVPLGAEDPRPGVLFLGRMAGEDRYGFAGPPPVDLGAHEIHDALAAAGFCVLRFDERGTGRSEAGDDLSYAAQLEDARRAYRTLLVQEQVDPDRIVIIGHGEGGLRAMSLAIEYGADIDGVALMAPPGRPYAQILSHQTEQRLLRAPAELRADTRKEQARLIAELEAGRTPPELAASAPWLHEVLALRPADMIGRVPARVFLAQGGKDFEVDPDVDATALHRAAKRHKVRVELHRYPNLDHLFKPEPEESTPSRYTLEDRHLDPAFLEDLITFTTQATK